MPIKKSLIASVSRSALMKNNTHALCACFEPL
jgi:hypothetical protein